MRETFKYWLSIFLLALLPAMAIAQSGKQFTIAGVVSDETGEPFPGANIYIKNSPGVGTSTDIDGKFRIKVAANSILVFQALGMKTQEILITKGNDKMRVVLKEDQTQLEEVVVTGLTSQKKVSVTSAISTVDVSQLATPATSINNMIGGRVAGVFTMQASGEPGKNISNFWIRGISTFGANSGALVLIDGLEGNLSDIDPDDVESFSILKDASATAVYGVRGANGVVLVTTKRGKEGKLTITGRATMKYSRLKRLPKYLGSYDYALLANEARALNGEEDLYSKLDLDLIRYGLDPEIYPNVNWIDEIINKGSWQRNYYASARGGGDIARYFLSVGFQDESSAYKQQDNVFKKPVSYNKLTYRANIDMNLTKSTKLYFGVDGHISTTTQPGGLNTDRVWGAVRALTPIMFPVTYADGTLPTYGKDELASPYAMLNYTGYSAAEANRTMLTLKAEQQFGGFLKGLTLSGQVMGDFNSGFNESRRMWPEMYRAIGRTSEGILIKNLRRQIQQVNYDSNTWSNRKYYLEGKADYNRTFNEHTVGALLFYYMEEYMNHGWTGIINSIPQRRQNVSGRLHYGFRNTYFIDTNFGYTGSTTFKKGERFGFFPSIAAGWVPTGYKWVNDNMPWLSFLKIRGSYGLAGNDQIGGNMRFPFLTLINNMAPAGWGYRNAGITETQTGADNLQWEVSKKKNIGVEAKLFHDKLSFTVDFFHDTRDHIFQQRVTLPQFVGNVTNPFSNVGRMHSYGSDGNIEYTHTFNKRTFMTVRANYTFSQNMVDYFEENKLPYDYQSISGKPWNIQRGLIAEGLFKSKEEISFSADQSAYGKTRPGDIKYRDVNGDGRINDDDRVPLSYSNQLPRLMYGFGADFHWRDLTVSVLFKGAAKSEYYRSGFGNESGWVPFVGGELGNVIAYANNPKNRWTPAWYSGDPATENPNAEFPRLSYGSNTNNSQLSTFWKRDGSYLRFQELGVKYKLKSFPWLRAVGLSAVDLEFVVNNIFTIDKVRFFDPEQASRNGGAYPIPTTYTFQVYLNF